MMIRTASVAMTVFGLIQPVLATGPSNQVIGSTPGSRLHSVVQLRPDASEVPVTASGSVIGRHVDTSGVGWLCVLTADHVVAAGFTSIAFGNGAPPSGGAFGGQGDWVFRSEEGGPDIAVLGIRYGAPDDFFASIVPLSLAPTDPALLVGQSFTQVGYGWTGELDAPNQTMRSVARSGVKGFQNNVVERIRNVNGLLGNYAYQAADWDFQEPGSAEAVVGEGSSFNGDSGSPYMLREREMVTLDDGTQMEVFSDGIGAVHTYGDGSSGHGWLGSGDHIPSGGVVITPAIEAWIVDRCLMVPTPGASVCISIGFLLAFRRKR